MHFRIQMHLSPEQEASMKSAMEAHSRADGGSSSTSGGVGYSVEIMSIPEAFEWFQGLKHAYDQEGALSKT
jgi:hypothetical protein